MLGSHWTHWHTEFPERLRLPYDKYCSPFWIQQDVLSDRSVVSSGMSGKYWSVSLPYHRCILKVKIDQIHYVVRSYPAHGVDDATPDNRITASAWLLKQWTSLVEMSFESLLQIHVVTILVFPEGTQHPHLRAGSPAIFWATLNWFETKMC